MSERILNISFNKSGAGNITPKIILPAKWIKEMGITADNRSVSVIFNEGDKTITICKAAKARE